MKSAVLTQLLVVQGVLWGVGIIPHLLVVPELLQKIGTTITSVPSVLQKEDTTKSLGCHWHTTESRYYHLLWLSLMCYNKEYVHIQPHLLSLMYYVLPLIMVVSSRLQRVYVQTRQLVVLGVLLWEVYCMLFHLLVVSCVIKSSTTIPGCPCCTKENNNTPFSGFPWCNLGPFIQGD